MKLLDWLEGGSDEGAHLKPTNYDDHVSVLRKMFADAHLSDAEVREIQDNSLLRMSADHFADQTHLNGDDRMLDKALESRGFGGPKTP